MGEKDLGYVAETLEHEFAVHAMKYLQLIQQLRSGTTGQQFINSWKSATAFGQYNNGVTQHQTFGRGYDMDYNTIHNQIRVQMKDPAIQQSFDNERAKDEFETKSIYH